MSQTLASDGPGGTPMGPQEGRGRFRGNMSTWPLSRMPPASATQGTVIDRDVNPESVLGWEFLRCSSLPPQSPSLVSSVSSSSSSSSSASPTSVPRDPTPVAAAAAAFLAFSIASRRLGIASPITTTHQLRDGLVGVSRRDDVISQPPAPTFSTADRDHDLGGGSSGGLDCDALPRGEFSAGTIAATITGLLLSLRGVDQQVTARGAIVKQLRRATANSRQRVPDQELGKLD
ncbi:hypothetical protein PG997_002307 [Apiospora hydei]|uniref:Uncharacterized protein n=1 Tax=Apiospora hydei TaxID=1337664 RepID=A0ABR1X909_9PEZI